MPPDDRAACLLYDGPQVTGQAARHKKSPGAILNVACDGPQGAGQDARHKKKPALRLAKIILEAM
ncbi:hypothetical protein DDT56_09735 [Brenneria corticis]|uniref:Uncharacterized protein n=1 Tax=Brenneria corticis TaxID=2173106 RepID=A0A2U1U3X8_9GAMM|nr:hypothetical protein DDT56_09735 [Brenneria sp. CFCC 11842]